MNKKILISCGEASGFKYAYYLIKALKRIDPDIEIYAVGNISLIEAGAILIEDLEKNISMGFAEVFNELKYFYKLFTKIEKKYLKCNYFDAVILIDFPEFNINLGKKAKLYNTKVFYYVCPQVWAWRKYRIKLLTKICDYLFVIFPFEKGIFKKYTNNVEFNGHPLIEIINEMPADEEFFKQTNLQETDKFIGIFPGSRKSVIKNHISGIQEAIREIDRKYKIIVSLSDNITEDFYNEIIDLKNNNILFIRGFNYNIIKNSIFSLMTTGTCNMEALFLKTPIIAFYKTSPVSFFIAKYIFRIDLKYFSIINILGNKQIISELIQEKFNKENLIKQINIIDSIEKRESIKKDYEKILQLYNIKRSFSESAAGKILNLI